MRFREADSDDDDDGIGKRKVLSRVLLKGISTHNWLGLLENRVSWVIPKDREEAPEGIESRTRAAFAPSPSFFITGHQI